MATADLAEDSRDVGVGDPVQEALWAALRSPSEPYASEIAASAAFKRGPNRLKNPAALVRTTPSVGASLSKMKLLGMTSPSGSTVLIRTGPTPDPSDDGR